MRLTDEQAELFLGPDFGVAATVCPDGSPHLTVVRLDWGGERWVDAHGLGR